MDPIAFIIKLPLLVLHRLLVLVLVGLVVRHFKVAVPVTEVADLVRVVASLVVVSLVVVSLVVVNLVVAVASLVAADLVRAVASLVAATGAAVSSVVVALVVKVALVTGPMVCKSL